MSGDPDKAALDLLAFYSEAGVDAVLRETAVDHFADPRFAEAPTPPTRSAAVARPPAPPAPPVRAPAFGLAAPPSAEAAMMTAREAAQSATDLNALREAMLRFEGCALRAT